MISKWELAAHWYANTNQLKVKNLDGLGYNVLWLFGCTNSYGLTVAERTKCTVQAQSHGIEYPDQWNAFTCAITDACFDFCVTGEDETGCKIKAELI